MAIKPVLPHFVITFKGDGNATSVAITLAGAPFSFSRPGTSSSFSVSGTVPTALTNLTCSDGQAVTANILAGVCTFAWPTAIPANTLVFVTGNMEF